MGINFTPKLCKKKRKVTMHIQELKTIAPLYLFHGLKNSTVFWECACAHCSDYLIPMRNTGCAAQNWGITLIPSDAPILSMLLIFCLNLLLTSLQPQRACFLFKAAKHWWVQTILWVIADKSQIIGRDKWIKG